MVLILDSGFCILRVIVELKKRRYCPKHVDGDQINSHFDDKDIGDIDSLPGRLDNSPFRIFGMKEIANHTAKREWVNSEEKKTVRKRFCHSEGY